MDRICSKCGLSKPLTDYAKQRNGHRYNCKVCDRVRKTRYRRKKSDETLPQREVARREREAARQAKTAEKERERQERAARPKKTDDPATWAAYSRQYKARIKNTWRWFFIKRWSGINRRTINGKNPKWDSPISAKYLRRGVELRMSRREFRCWCYLNREEIEEMYRDGRRPSIDRIDSKGHYEIKNIQVIPFIVNCHKDCQRPST